MIEMIGQPGAGKSTAALRVATELGIGYDMIGGRRFTGVPGNDARSDAGGTKYSEAVQLLRRRPALIGIGLRLAVGRRERALLDIGMLAARRSLIQESLDEVLVDEGLRHGLATNLSRTGVIPDADVGSVAGLFARHISCPGTVVWLRCDPRLSWERVHQRGNLDQHSFPKDDYDAFARYIDRYDTIAGVLTESCPLIELEVTDLTHDEVVATVVERVSRV